MMTMKYMIANINPNGIRKLEKPEDGLAWKNVAKIMLICETDPFFLPYLQALIQPGSGTQHTLKKHRKTPRGKSPRVPAPPLSWILAAAVRLPAVIFGARNQALPLQRLGSPLRPDRPHN